MGGSECGDPGDPSSLVVLAAGLSGTLNASSGELAFRRTRVGVGSATATDTVALASAAPTCVRVWLGVSCREKDA